MSWLLSLISKTPLTLEARRLAIVELKQELQDDCIKALDRNKEVIAAAMEDQRNIQATLSAI